MADKLAISGGTPILNRGDYQNWPVITEDDRRFVNEVLDSGIVAGGTGPQVVALEKEWAEFVGAKHCLTTCSGTAALHMALGRLCAGQELWGKARSYLETVISMRPTPEAYQEYGALLAQMGEADAAADAAARAMPTAPATNCCSGGQPGTASAIPTMAVKTIRATTLGLQSSR